MVWLFGVAVGITCAQKLDWNHFVIFAHARGIELSEYQPMGLADSVIAIGFGTGFSLAILAVTRSGPGFRRDPARIGITVLGVIATFAFLVELFATSYVIRTGQTTILGAGYWGFCDLVKHSIGFVIVCSMTPWVKVRWNWAFAWWSLILFALVGVLIHSSHFPVIRNSQPWLSELLTSHWHAVKIMQTAISVVGLGVAIVVDLWKRNSISWLVVVTTLAMIIAQIAMHVRDISALFAK